MGAVRSDVVSTRPTRGTGSLESILAHWRSRIASNLLGEQILRGHILDIGCGQYPSLLTQIDAELRVGLDCQCPPVWSAVMACEPGLFLLGHDVARSSFLPFREDSFDGAALLAVVEHLKHDVVVRCLHDIRRVLRPSGRVVITAPSVQGQWLLGPLARLGLVSKEEVEEHETGYTPAMLLSVLAEAGFTPSTVRAGRFQCGLNCWAAAEKVDTEGESLF